MKATYKNIPNYYRVEGFCDVAKNIHGELFYLCDRLTDNDKRVLLTMYDNIDLYIAKSQYANEIERNVILIKDSDGDGDVYN